MTGGRTDQHNTIRPQADGQLRRAKLRTLMPWAAAGEGDDFCSGLGFKASDMPVAQGGLSGGEWLLLLTYVMSIGLILKGAWVDVSVAFGRDAGRLI